MNRSRQYALRVGAVAGFAFAAAAHAQVTTNGTAAEHPASNDCSSCHTCATPTADAPCLPHCTRSSTVVIGEQFKQKHGPDVVILGELEDRYLPVPFDHKGHAKMAEMTRGCVVCHHYTPEGLEHPACKTCHELNPANVDMRKPSLKGAYHRQCMACHREWSGNTECLVCHHAKTGSDGSGQSLPMMPTKDDLIGRMHPPIPEPDTKIYRTRVEGENSTEVLFRHREHIHKYGFACAECHREEGCARCHQDNTANEPRQRTLADHHRPCSACHTEVNPGADGQKRCNACHYATLQGPPRPFQHSVAQLPLMKYHRGNACRDCHTSTPFAKLSHECGDCHDNWSHDNFDHVITGQRLNETHEDVDCTDCHTDGRYTVPPTCTECHDEDEVSFPAKRPGPTVTR